MPRLRIDKKGYSTFTGQMGDVAFVNGESVESVSESEARRLGSFIAMVAIETDKQVGYGQEMVDIKSKTAAEVSEPLKMSRKKPEDKKDRPKLTLKEAKAKRDKEKAAKAAKAEQERLAKEKTNTELTYTEDSLSELADTKGINGLRDFAKDYDVYGRSIVEIIGKLMQLKNYGAAKSG